MRMYANRFLTQSRKGAEKRRGLSFLLCATLRLCVSALIFSAPTAFGQSITATKAYVDRKYAEATNAVPSIVTNEIRLVSSNAVNESGWVYTWGEWEIVEARLLPDGKPFEGVTIVPYLEGWIPSVGGMTFDTVQGTEDSSDITWYEADAYVINAQRRRVWEYRRNALGLAMAKDLEMLPTHETVTNVARSVVNSVWDASLGVAWEARMHNGHLYYIAVTNKPPEVK